MEDREERRDRTIRYGERTRRVHLRWVHPRGPVDCLCEQSAWFFAKGKSLGCGCRRSSRRGGPKVTGGLCRGAGGAYQPCVVERIRGNRLCRAWLSELRGEDPYDVEL